MPKRLIAPRSAWENTTRSGSKASRTLITPVQARRLASNVERNSLHTLPVTFVLWLAITVVSKRGKTHAAPTTRHASLHLTAKNAMQQSRRGAGCVIVAARNPKLLVSACIAAAHLEAIATFCFVLIVEPQDFTSGFPRQSVMSAGQLCTRLIGNIATGVGGNR